MNQRGLYQLFFSFILTVYGTLCHAQERELRVSYKLIEGECLYEKNWTKVSGSAISWDITDVTSNRHIDSHSYNFLKYEPVSLSKDRVKLKYFQYLNADVYKISPLPSTFMAELSFLNQKKKELANGELELARLIFVTDEHTLARLNSLNEEISFKKFSDKSVLIPGDLTVCKLKINTLMNGAKARFIKKFFGGVTIKNDETVSVRQGEKSFATELFR